MEKEMTRKSIFLNAWENKIGYSLNYKDIKELETIIDYYETQLKKQQETIDKIKKLIKQYGKYDGQKCTRNFQMWTADFNKLLQILENKEVL